MSFNPNPDLPAIIAHIRLIAQGHKPNTATRYALNGYLDLLTSLLDYDSEDTDLDQLVWDQEQFWKADEAETARGRYEWQK